MHPDTYSTVSILFGYTIYRATKAPTRKLFLHRFTQKSRRVPVPFHKKPGTIVGCSAWRSTAGDPLHAAAVLRQALLCHASTAHTAFHRGYLSRHMLAWHAAASHRGAGLATPFCEGYAERSTVAANRANCPYTPPQEGCGFGMITTDIGCARAPYPKAGREIHDFVLSHHQGEYRDAGTACQ